MYIDPEYCTTNTIHRNLAGDDIKQRDSILGCGFLTKNKDYKMSSFLFEHYSGFYILKGNGEYVDYNGIRHELSPGCFVQRMPGVPHNTYIDDKIEWLEFFIDIGNSVFKGMSDAGVLDAVNPVLHVGESEELLLKMVNFLDAMCNAKVAKLPFMLVKALEILCEITEMSRKNINKDTSFIPLACKLIRENNKVGTNIRDIADTVNVSYESFRKLFKKSTGLSPTEYMINARINTAKSLLADHDMPIKEVAAALNYTDVFAFSKQFKEYAGVAPGEFIKKDMV